MYIKHTKHEKALLAISPIRGWVLTLKSLNRVNKSPLRESKRKERGGGYYGSLLLPQDVAAFVAEAVVVVGSNVLALEVVA